MVSQTSSAPGSPEDGPCVASISVTSRSAFSATTMFSLEPIEAMVDITLGVARPDVTSLLTDPMTSCMSSAPGSTREDPYVASMSAFPAAPMSSLEPIEGVGDVSSGHGELDFEPLLSDPAVSSKSCSSASWTFFLGFHLKQCFHADFIFL